MKVLAPFSFESALRGPPRGSSGRRLFGSCLGVNLDTEVCSVQGTPPRRLMTAKENSPDFRLRPEAAARLCAAIDCRAVPSLRLSIDRRRRPHRYFMPRGRGGYPIGTGAFRRSERHHQRKHDGATVPSAREVSMIRLVNRILISSARTLRLGVLFAFMAGLLASAPALAEVLASWNPAGTVNSANPLSPASVSPNVLSAGNLSGGPGLTSPGPFASAYVLDNWSAGAFDSTDYLGFSVSGNNVTYQSVTFSLYNNFDGTGNWEIRSSVDGFSSALDAGTFTGIFGGGLFLTANVSAIGQRSGTVEFRIYTFNNAGATNPVQRGIRGTALGGQGLSVIGTVAPTGPVVSQPVPTLGTLGLVALVLLLGLITFLMRRA
jgi:hypothetical protein